LSSQEIWGDLVRVSKLDQRIKTQLPLLQTILSFGESKKLTYKKIEIDPMLTTAMDSMLNCEDYSDVILVIEGREIFAHRAILSSRSAYFNAMFAGKMREAEIKRIVIEDVHYDTIYILVRVCSCCE